ncbi:MAG: PEP-CTERM sorting domain-containing protein [Pirellulaceae bacterium]|nr:PEP-CTERM sorting domain-containing protein [Pirellulaceae bacterium]
MKNVALTLVAVLAMVSVSMAQTYDIGGGLSITVGAPVALEGNLVSYTLTGNGVTGWQGLVIEGSVHQVHPTWVATTPFSDSYTMMGGTAAAMVYDTHIIRYADFTETGAGVPITETCDGTTTGVDTSGFGTLTKLGMGTFAMAPLHAIGVASATPPANVDFMQVVIPVGDLVYLKGIAGGLVEGVAREYQITAENPNGIAIGVPEPGTIMLLLSGVLCLMGIRRR